MSSMPSEEPELLDRIIQHFGSIYALEATLGVARSVVRKWRERGYFIPADYALDIHELGIEDRWGKITAMTVLYAARRGRIRRLRERGLDIEE